MNVLRFALRDRLIVRFFARASSYVNPRTPLPPFSTAYGARIVIAFLALKSATATWPGTAPREEHHRGGIAAERREVNVGGVGCRERRGGANRCGRLLVIFPSNGTSSAGTSSAATSHTPRAASSHDVGIPNVPRTAGIHLEVELGGAQFSRDFRWDIDGNRAGSVGTRTCGSRLGLGGGDGW